MPRVTVVIPSYNHGRFLPRRFETILGQTYRDYEILFLDDGSTDDSLAVLERYKGLPNLRAFINPTNGGSVFKQWNRGVRAARGEYVWLAESDDASDPRFLQTLVELLDAHPRVGLAYCNSRYIDELDRPGEALSRFVEELHPSRWRANFINDGIDECRRYLCLMNTVPNASAVVFRKRLYEEIGGADETKRLCGDWVTWIKLLLVGDVAYVAETLNHYRVPHEKSVRRHTMSNAIYLQEYLAILKLIEEKAPPPPEVRRLIVDCLARQWRDQAYYGQGPSHPLNYWESLRRAEALNTDYLLAILSSALECTINSHRALAALTWELEQAKAKRFWSRVRRLLFPQNSWRHRLARGVVRLFQGKAA